MAGDRYQAAVGDLGPATGRQFLEAVRNDPLFELWWLVALRGPRRGEMAGLRWEDIDLADGSFKIREQVIIIDGAEHIGPPKSAAGVRTVHLGETSVEILWQLWPWQRRCYQGVDPKGRVFRHPDGRPVNPDWLTRRFTALVVELDPPPSRLHDLRHVAASIASAAGNSLKSSQELMGHASAVTTAEYQVVFSGAAKTAAHEAAELLLAHANVRTSLGGASQA